jgi:hypothetical protein
MSRYYVIDATCEEFEELVLPGQRGQLLGIFNTLDSAQALANQRAAQGGVRVVVVDSIDGHQGATCFQAAASDDEPVPTSGKRQWPASSDPEAGSGSEQTA